MRLEVSTRIDLASKLRCVFRKAHFLLLIERLICCWVGSYLVDRLRIDMCNSMGVFFREAHFLSEMAGTLSPAVSIGVQDVKE